MKEPGNLAAILHNKCPRCRKGDLFKTKNPYRLKGLFSMYDNCPACGQKIKLKIDFWYISNYITYTFCGILSIVSFLLYCIFIGITWRDNSLFHWMIFNAILIIILAPPLMRVSRTIYLNFYVKYDPQTKEIENEEREYKQH